MVNKIQFQTIFINEMILTSQLGGNDNYRYIYYLQENRLDNSSVLFYV